MATDFVVVPAQLTSLLSAVNVLIGSLGEAPVTALDPSPSSDVDSALIALDNADLTVQSMHGGWYWNTEYDLPTTLDGNGKVPLPQQVLAVTAAYFTPSQDLAVVQRGDPPFLYDLGRHTYTWTEAPHIDVVARLSWDELPIQARLYITYLACQLFHAQNQERQILLSVTNQRVTSALVSLEQFDDLIAKRNTIQNNVSVVAGIQGQGGLRRNRQGL